MNSNENNQNQMTTPQDILNANLSMTNVQEVQEDIARDTAEVEPPTFEDALEPGFAGTKANKVRAQIQEDLQKAQQKRME